MYATTFVLLMATMFGPPAETSAERSTRIYVRTTPPGASIVVDGKELGTSDGLFLVPPGVRTVTLEMDGYDPEAKRIDVREGWITRVEVTMNRGGTKPDGAGTTASKSGSLYFVRWVIQDEKTMTFEGEPVTLDQLPSLLEKVPNRAQTVLEMGYSTDISVKLRDEYVARAGALAHKLGFRHASDIGQQKLGSKGSPPQEVQDQAAGAANNAPRWESPDEVVRELLDAVRAGDNAKAVSLFTPAARAKFKKLGYLVAPVKSSTATFAVGDVTHLEDGRSRVSGSWTDYGRTDQMIWILRSGDEGWRIVGMETLARDGVPALLLDFENLEEATKNILVWAEAVQKQQDAKTSVANTVPRPEPPADVIAEYKEDRPSVPVEMKGLLSEQTQIQTELEAARQKYGSQHPETRGLEERARNLSQLIQLHRKIADYGQPRSQKVFQRILYDLDERVGLQTIDLDTGWSYDLPEGILRWEPELRCNWFEERQIDLIAKHADDQWALGLIPPGGVLVPANDISLDEAADSVSSILKDKERLRGLTFRHEEGVMFWLLPNDSKPPLSFAVRTAAGTEAFLQIVELNETKPKSIRLRWRVTKPGEETPGDEDALTRKIQLPDADTKDTPVVLDLASGEMLKLPWESEDTNAARQETDQDTGHFTKLGKGDLAFDRQLFCLRGGTIELAAEDAGQELNMTGKKDDAKAYQLPKLPCELLVTTPEKRQFVVKILDETPAGGLNLEYLQVKGTAKQQADSTEPRPDAGPRDLEGWLQEGKSQMAPEGGVLDFRIAASEEEGKTFAETGKGLGWYDASPWMNDTAGLVTREAEGRTQILLWQTAEKSLTASQPAKEKWRVVEVSVIAEPDKPGRIGVVFDVEGGRRLRELTTANIDRRLAVVVDGHVVGCPVVRSPIGERVEITGSFSKAELARLATALQAGMEAEQP